MSSVSTNEGTRAKSNVQEAVRETAEVLKSQAGVYAESARQTAEDVADRAADMGRQASNSVQEVGANFRQAIERSVEQQPLTTVLLAVAAGVVLGGLMRR